MVWTGNFLLSARGASVIPMGNLNFTGTWKHGRKGKCTTAYWTNDPSASVTYEFTGTGCSITIPSGSAQYRIDGGAWKQGQFNTSTASSCPSGGSGFSETNLPLGKHTLTVQYAGATGSSMIVTNVSIESAPSSTTLTSPQAPSSSTIGSASSPLPTTSALPASDSKTTGLPIGALAGIIIAFIAACLLIAFFILRRHRRRPLRIASMIRDPSTASPLIHLDDPGDNASLEARTLSIDYHLGKHPRTQSPQQHRPWVRGAPAHRPVSLPPGGLATPSIPEEGSARENEMASLILPGPPASSGRMDIRSWAADLEVGRAR